MRPFLARLILAVVLAFVLAAEAGATPPVSGNTLDFGPGSDAGVSLASIAALAAGDLDRDGDPDLVTADAAGALIAWENDGTPFAGAWATAAIGTAPGPVAAIALGDLDRDGYLDVVTGGELNGGYEITVAQNDHSPFDGAWPVTHGVGHVTASVQTIGLGDWDLDGDLDIASGALNGGIIVWNNTPTRFTADWTGSLAGTADDAVRSLAVGDVNNDGRPDIVSGCDTAGDYTLNAWLNADDSPFTGGWTQVDVGNSPALVSALVLGDFDRDGDLDVAAGRAGGTLAAWQNPLAAGAALPDDWTSQNVGAAAAALLSLATGDLDGDGDLDLVAAAGSAEDNEVIVWQNDNPFGAAWTQTDVGASGGNVFAAVLSDLDGDGDLDIATGAGTAADAELVVWPNTHVHRNAGFAAGGFDAGATGTAGVFQMALGDLDNDGDLDAVTVTRTTTDEVIAWENDGTPFAGGTWAAHPVGSPDVFVLSVALGDLDNDGDLDIVTGGDNPGEFEVIAWENDGTPFESAWDAHDVGSPNDNDVQALVLGDLDNDGDLDIVTASEDPAMELLAWQNTGEPFAALWTAFDLGNSPQLANALALGDLDNDGDLDVVSGHLFGVDQVVIWRNDDPFGGAWATSSVVGSADYTIFALAVGDLDRDGYQDIVSGSLAQAGGLVEVLAWQNDGAPFGSGWNAGDVAGAAANVETLALGDLDADGDLDVVSGAASGAEPEVVARLNDGTPFDGAWTGVTVGEAVDEVSSVALGDLDHDGDLDVMGATGSSEDFELIAWQNTGASAALAAFDTAPQVLPAGAETPLLQVAFGHNGIAGDANLELHSFNLTLARADCTTPLDTAEAAALFTNLRARLDGGDDLFQTSDPLVADVVALVLTGGVQAVDFDDGAADVQMSVGASGLYWVSVVTADDAPAQDPSEFCLLFDPDADALVQAKGSDYSISVADTSQATTGGTQIAWLNFMPLAIHD